MFNPARPYMLYASFRRHEIIYAWDLRGDVSSPVYAFGEEASASAMRAATGVNTRTNQKLKFDVDIAGDVLGVGDQVGRLWSAGRHLRQGIIHSTGTCRFSKQYLGGLMLLLRRYQKLLACGRLLCSSMPHMRVSALH